MITGIEAALDYLYVGADRESPSFFAQANIARDAFSDAVPVPVVLWLLPAASALLARYAPDFWHWRAATFDFTGPEPDQLRRENELLSLDQGKRLSLPREDRRQNVTELHDQLKRAELADDADSSRGILRRWRLLNQLDQAHHDEGELDQALKCQEQALELAKKIDEPTEAISLNNLAALLQATNRLAEAEPLMRRALAIDEQSYGAEHPEVAIDLNNLAQLLKATNRLAEAEPLMRRALAIDEQSYGAEHPKVAIRLNNLAQLLQATNRLAEAEPLIRRALAIDEQSYGAEHPRVAIDLNNLAQLLQATNRLAEAEPLIRRALAIDEQSYGAEHPNVAIDLNNLAQLLQATNRLAEAEPLMRRNLEIFLNFKQNTGHEHPHLQAAFENYASLLEATGLSKADVQQRLDELRAKYQAPSGSLHD